MGIINGMNSATRLERRSPLKERPLRLPGQSVERQIDDVVFDEVLSFGTLIVLAVTWPLYEWTRWFLRTPPSPPWPITSAALLGLIYASLRLARAKKRLDTLKLGRDGERVVAEKLNEVRGTDTSARVFHDIVAPGFNIDHVILSRHGVYAIETKTISKPARRKAQVVFDGMTLLVGGRTLDRDPVAQAEAVANWIRATLKEMTAKEYPVKPVLVFPGWYVNPVREHRGARVWVLTPGALPTFVANQPVTISEEDLKLAVYFLSRYNKNS